MFFWDRWRHRFIYLSRYEKWIEFRRTLNHCVCVTVLCDCHLSDADGSRSVPEAADFGAERFDVTPQRDLGLSS